jgi:hypothetical protein
MRRGAAIAAFAAFAVLAGCAAAPVPGTTVQDERTAQVVPGRTTKAELLSMLGKTKAVVFDSGYEAWLYDIPSGGGRFAEFVVLVDPRGIVAKTRRRPPALPDQ